MNIKEDKEVTGRKIVSGMKGGGASLPILTLKAKTMASPARFALSTSVRVTSPTAAMITYWKEDSTAQRRAVRRSEE